VYEKAAKAAYENCLQLLDEANLLYNNSRFPRAYVLSILCLEEFAKSFLYKCVSVGLITDKDFDVDIKKHEEKLYHAVHIMLFPYAMGYRQQKFNEAIENDKHEKDHSKHVSLEAFERLYNIFKYTDDIPEMTESVNEIFKDAHLLKLKGLYVDIQRNNIIIPQDIIDSNKCKRVLEFLNRCANGFDTILGSNDDHFKNLVELLDPYIYSGTIKSNFEKYKLRFESNNLEWSVTEKKVKPREAKYDDCSQ
jgi:AbiV family abortive infection protein